MCLKVIFGKNQLYPHRKLNIQLHQTQLNLHTQNRRLHPLSEPHPPSQTRPGVDTSIQRFSLKEICDINIIIIYFKIFKKG